MGNFSDRWMSGVRRPSCVVRQQLLQTTSPPKPLSQFQPNFTGMFLGWSFLKIAKRIEIHEELWLPWQPIEKLRKIH